MSQLVAYSGNICVWVVLCDDSSPRYNRNGWLGVKHQVTYLLDRAMLSQHKVFVQCKSFCKVQNLVCRDYSKCIHVCKHTHMSILPIQNLTHNLNGQQTDLRQRKTLVWNRKLGRSMFWKKKHPEVWFEEVQGGFLSEMKGKVIPHRWAKDWKGMGTNNGKSGTRNLGRHLVNKWNNDLRLQSNERFALTFLVTGRTWACPLLVFGTGLVVCSSVFGMWGKLACCRALLLLL